MEWRSVSPFYLGSIGYSALKDVVLERMFCLLEAVLPSQCMRNVSFPSHEDLIFGVLVRKAKWSRWFVLICFDLAWFDIYYFMFCRCALMILNGYDLNIVCLFTTLLPTWISTSFPSVPPPERSFGPWRQMRSCCKIMGSMWMLHWSIRWGGLAPLVYVAWCLVVKLSRGSWESLALVPCFENSWPQATTIHSTLDFEHQDWWSIIQPWSLLDDGRTSIHAGLSALKDV